MRARRARVFREFSPVRGSGPVRVLVRPPHELEADQGPQVCLNLRIL